MFIRREFLQGQACHAGIGADQLQFLFTRVVIADVVVQDLGTALRLLPGFFHQQRDGDGRCRRHGGTPG